MRVACILGTAKLKLTSYCGGYIGDEVGVTASKVSKI